MVTIEDCSCIGQRHRRVRSERRLDSAAIAPLLCHPRCGDSVGIGLRMRVTRPVPSGLRKTTTRTMPPRTGAIPMVTTHIRFRGWIRTTLLPNRLRRSARARSDQRGHDLQFRLSIEFIESIGGANKRLTLPDGGTLDVTIPAGIVEGQVLRLRGTGAPGSGNGGFGDALIEIDVKPDRLFTRRDDDSHLELPVALTEAVLGARVKVPTPTGAVTMTVPKGSNTGKVPRLRGRGAPRHSGGHGDQLVKLKVMLPKKPDRSLKHTPQAG
jgi:DnaJ-class molecular chaperone